MRSLFAVGAIGLVSLASGHGSHSQKPDVDENADWMTRHMAEEHHMDSWDAGAFFALHDYNSDGIWNADEMLRTYGLMDESNAGVSAQKRSDILKQLLDILDTDGDNTVSRREFADFMASGRRLPDVGMGPGHHGDDEYEYEIHHWEKYHDENTKLEDLTHPEDIEHFKKHEEMEDAQEKLEAMDKMAIVEDNIPMKFRRRQWNKR